MNKDSVPIEQFYGVDPAKVLVRNKRFMFSYRSFDNDGQIEIEPKAFY